jgi:site-specific DNA-methyltransferase (adenine-specific)
MKCLVLSECLAYLKTLQDPFPLIYIDPPFNTQKIQRRSRIKVVQDAEGSRMGFGGKKYKTELLESPVYQDAFENFLGFLAPRFEQAYRLLAPTGSLFVHLDYREVHYAKVLLDSIFGRESFINEIIWAYDYGGRSKNRWPAKHDTILWYAKDPANYTFNYGAIDRIPYMLPKWWGPKKPPVAKPQPMSGGKP